MARGVIQANIQSANGYISVAAGASVSITVASSGAAASLYDARSGGSAVSNPVTADSKGFFRVYVDPGRYNISATLAGSTQTFNDVVVLDDAPAASGIEYDNTESGLTAENVQAAIDELAGTPASSSSAITEVTVTPPTDANYTLAEAEYTADKINLDLSNWTTDKSLIVPDEDRRWTFYNASTTRAPTVKTSAGTGKTVPVSSSRLLECDGTNVGNPITAVSELKQLEVATGSSGNVSRQVATLPGNGTSNGYWFKVATVQMNTTTYRDVTVSLRVLSKANLSGHFDVMINLRQDTSTFSRARSAIRVQSMVATATAYAPMFRAVAPADALGQAVDVWVQASASYQEFVVFEIGKSYIDTERVTYYSSGSWQVTEPTGVFVVKSYSGSFGGRQLANVVDTSDLLVDIILHPGETAIVSWTSQTSRALRINTTNGGIYMISGDTDMAGPDTAISLTPNNTSYSSQFNEFFERVIAGATPSSVTASASSIQLAYGQRNVNAPMFFSGEVHIGSTGGVANALKRYTGVCKALVAGVNEARYYTTEWNNNSTIWSSLGTLNFGNPCSGVATIKRIS
jgi:hypothetical protein